MTASVFLLVFHRNSHRLSNRFTVKSQEARHSRLQRLIFQILWHKETKLLSSVEMLRSLVCCQMGLVSNKSPGSGCATRNRYRLWLHSVTSSRNMWMTSMSEKSISQQRQLIQRPLRSKTQHSKTRLATFVPSKCIRSSPNDKPCASLLKVYQK